MADEEISLDKVANTGVSGNKKLVIIIVVATLLLLSCAAVVAYYSISSDDSDQAEQQSATQLEQATSESEQILGALDAYYVAMPRPFVFNVLDGKRDRLVQIKVQLMVRGHESETLAKKHIPLLEGTLVREFSAATIAQLRSPDGKDVLRATALKATNASIQKLEGKAIIDSVLFTGFVLQ